MCILVFKKCKKHDDVLFINASEQFEPGKKQNQLRDADIDKIVSTYQFRTEEARYSRRVLMGEIKKNDYNLNISRYVSTAEPEEEIDLQKVHDNLAGIAQNIATTAEHHNQFLQELGLPALPWNT